MRLIHKFASEPHVLDCGFALLLVPMKAKDVRTLSGTQAASVACKASGIFGSHGQNLRQRPASHAHCTPNTSNQRNHCPGQS